MSGHTPGPITFGKPFGMESMYHTFLKDANGEFVARVDSRIRDHEPEGQPELRGYAGQVCHERAALFAAAPDLLEALKLALAEMLTPDADYLDAVRAARAAIAKAGAE